MPSSGRFGVVFVSARSSARASFLFGQAVTSTTTPGRFALRICSPARTAIQLAPREAKSARTASRRARAVASLNSLEPALVVRTSTETQVTSFFFPAAYRSANFTSPSISD